MLAESGGRASPLTKRIAAAGSYGRWRSNIPRDINRALQLPLDTWHGFIVSALFYRWGNSPKEVLNLSSIRIYIYIYIYVYTYVRPLKYVLFAYLDPYI